MITSLTTFQNEDLVLRVRGDYDPHRIRLHLYEAFIDALCGDREYQKQAIRSVCQFLGGGQYKSTSELAEENFGVNSRLLDRYGSVGGLIQALPFPNKLACNVDLATGTGKSWVIYGVARILLAEGVVDRVLLLCPSLTIEAGLRAKFVKFSSSRSLTDLIPKDAAFRVADITNASATTGPGDICVENIDATYKHVRSSVRDSFAGKGGTTLVLNDETHHVFSRPAPVSGGIRRWKEFLDAAEFSFTRIAGFSGTCYLGNAYFPDVIARYSLLRAMEEGRVKLVHYVSKDESNTQEEQFQKSLRVHIENQKRYPTLKPLSIVVTARIDTAQQLASDFAVFLAKELRISRKAAEERVLVVTSKHPAGVAKLPYVDRRTDPTEWIFSVSMLTEGWDVQNVFQIIPHEQRAFNSKLLIAQVLGRGLRVPSGVSRPVVRVFNHSKWSSQIKNLVDEVLEQESRLHSAPVESGEHERYHFDVHDLSYRTRTTEQELKLKNGNGQLNLFKRGFISFESQPEVLERHTTFASALDGTEYDLATKVHYSAYSIDEVVQKLQARLKSIDAEAGTRYARDYPAKLIRSVLQSSLEKIGDKRGLVSEANLQHAFGAIGTIQRKMAKTVRIELEPEQLKTVSTRTIRARSIALTSFMKEATVFYDSESESLSGEEDRAVLAQVVDENSRYPKRAALRVPNKFNFRSPVNVVLTTHEPERSFVRRLFQPQISEKIAGWIKSPDVGFYEVSYSWRKGEHTKQAKFNPDLFIRLLDGRTVLVIELKEDDDVDDENRAKLKYALEHFKRINEYQKEATYQVVFISPRSYDQFFQAIQADRITGFVSSLQAALLP